MGFDPVTMGLAIGTAALGAGGGIANSISGNSAIDDSVSSARRGAIETQRQEVNRAAVERRENTRRAQLVRGRVRVAAGTAGISSSSGSTLAIERQVAYDEALNRAISDDTLAGNLRINRINYRTTAANLNARRTSPILQGFTGGLAGLSTGLSIGGAIEGLR